MTRVNVKTQRLLDKVNRLVTEYSLDRHDTRYWEDWDNFVAWMRTQPEHKQLSREDLTSRKSYIKEVLKSEGNRKKVDDANAEVYELWKTEVEAAFDGIEAGSGELAFKLLSSLFKSMEHQRARSPSAERRKRPEEPGVAQPAAATRRERPQEPGAANDQRPDAARDALMRMIQEHEEKELAAAEEKAAAEKAAADKAAEEKAAEEKAAREEAAREEEDLKALLADMAGEVLGDSDSGTST